MKKEDNGMNAPDSMEQRLRSRGVRPTAVRLLVFAALKQAAGPVSMNELEILLQTVDKSSIFRTLTVFLDHHLIHSVEDGSGSVRYELCSGEWSCSVRDMHLHFFCTSCHRTFCFTDTPIPEMTLPDGFVMQGVNFVIKGICPQCNKKASI